MKALNNIAEIAIDEVQKAKSEQEDKPQEIIKTAPADANLKKTLPEN